jgi:hypothetical protein
MPEPCCIPEGPAPICPLTGLPTLPIARSTVMRFVTWADVSETLFGFCDVPTCEVVYVGANGEMIGKDQLKVRVGAKESSDPKPVCYCWGFDEQQIVEDFHQHGRSTIRLYIQEQVRAERCRCESTNPSGRCCLGDVGRAIAMARFT